MEFIWGIVGVFFAACRLQELKKEGSSGDSESEVFFSSILGCPKMLRRVLAAAGALFPLGRPVAKNVDFWVNLGIALGAKSSTIFTLGSLSRFWVGVVLIVTF